MADIIIVKIKGHAISNREARLVSGGKIIARSDFSSNSAQGRAAAIDRMIAKADKLGLNYSLKTA